MRRSTSALLIVIFFHCLSSTADAQATFLKKSADEWARLLKETKGDAAVRRNAAFALGKCGKANAAQAGRWVVDLTLALGDKDEGVREAAAFALGEFGISASSAVPKLVEMVKSDPAAGPRRGAITALGMIRPTGTDADAQTAANCITGALEHQDPRIRQNAAWALGQLGPRAMEPGINHLTRCVEDTDVLVRRDAIVALSKAGPLAKGAAGQLARALDGGEDEMIRQYAAMAIGNLGAEGGAALAGSVPALRKALADPDPLVREFVALGLFHLGKPAAPAVRELTTALTDTEWKVRQNAAAALAKIGPDAGEDPTVKALVKALKEETHTKVRQQVADALAELQDRVEPAVPAIVEQIGKDSDPVVRKYLTTALGWVDLGDARFRTARDRLVQVALKDSDPVVRYQAAYVIAERLGPDGAEVVPTLIKFLNDPRVQRREGTAGTAKTGPAEGMGGGTKVEEVGGGDARVLAVKALAKINTKQARDALEAALRSTTSADLKKAIQMALSQ